MITPDALTDYDRIHSELEELLIFSLFVAGKGGHRTAKVLNEFLTDKGLCYCFCPFTYVKRLIWEKRLHTKLREAKVGCYKVKSAGLEFIASHDYNLYQIQLPALLAIPGIGM